MNQDKLTLGSKMLNLCLWIEFMNCLLLQIYHGHSSEQRYGGDRDGDTLALLRQQRSQPTNLQLHEWWVTFYSR